MSLLKTSQVLIPIVRYLRRPRWIRPYLRDLYYRRLDQGPEPYRSRSVWSNWNFDAELTAFTHRIDAKVPLATLRRAFTDCSFARKQAEDSQTSEQSNLQGFPDNAQDAEAGRHVAQSYMLVFLRAAYPRMPEEWVHGMVQHLLNPVQLAFTSAHLGIKDLVSYDDGHQSTGFKIRSPSSPPSNSVLSDALLAVCNVLYQSNSTLGLTFIRDFLLTPLVDLDVTGELVSIDNPLMLLTGMLAVENRGKPEPRLQHQCGMRTLLSCYQVGIYCEKQLIGEAPGETVEIAQHEAACQAIRNLIGLSEHRPSLPLSGPLTPPDVTGLEKKNVSLQTYLELSQKDRQENHTCTV